MFAMPIASSVASIALLASPMPIPTTSPTACALPVSSYGRRYRAAHHRGPEHQAALQLFHRSAFLTEESLSAASSEGLHDGRAGPLRALLQDE